MAAALCGLLNKESWAGRNETGKPAVIRPPCAAGRLDLPSEVAGEHVVPHLNRMLDLGRPESVRVA